MPSDFHELLCQTWTVAAAQALALQPFGKRDSHSVRERLAGERSDCAGETVCFPVFQAQCHLLLVSITLSDI